MKGGMLRVGVDTLGLPSVLTQNMLVVDLLPSPLVNLPTLAVQHACVALTAVLQVASHKLWVITLLST